MLSVLITKKKKNPQKKLVYNTITTTQALNIPITSSFFWVWRGGFWCMHISRIGIMGICLYMKGLLVVQMVKKLPAMWQTWAQFLGWEDTLEKELVTYSNILAWKIPWTEEPCGLQSMGSQRVRYD